MGRSGRAPTLAVVKDAPLPSRHMQSPATAGTPSSPASCEPTPELSGLLDRAANAAKQMRYFGLVAQRSSFSELAPSAERAGFALINEVAHRKQAKFRWATGEPDFIFDVSFEHPDRASVIAESCGDVFGLVLVSDSRSPNISVETKPWLGNNELGRNALLFRDVFLMFPDFDGTPAWTKY